MINKIETEETFFKIEREIDSSLEKLNQINNLLCQADIESNKNIEELNNIDNEIKKIKQDLQNLSMDNEEEDELENDNKKLKEELNLLKNQINIGMAQSESVDTEKSSENVIDSENSSFDKQWINDHQNLIQKACYELDSFEKLIDELNNCNHLCLYNTIRDSWNDKNIYDINIRNGKRGDIFAKQTFDQ